jgi:hypothetical protein
VVKVDNAREARPARGLGNADLVYIEPVEGGASRIIAVFASQRPPVVGPVRSARETDLQLLPQFGHPALAFSGAAPSLMHLIAHAAVQDASAQRVPRAYFRDSNRGAPHNLFVRPGLLPKGGEWPADSRPRFGPAPVGGVASRQRWCAIGRPIWRSIGVVGRSSLCRLTTCQSLGND